VAYPAFAARKGVNGFRALDTTCYLVVLGSEIYVNDRKGGLYHHCSHGAEHGMGHRIVELVHAPQLCQRHRAVDVVSPCGDRIISAHDRLLMVSLNP
jgi:hypothetical protein